MKVCVHTRAEGRILFMLSHFTQRGTLYSLARYGSHIARNSFHRNSTAIALFAAAGGSSRMLAYATENDEYLARWSPPRRRRISQKSIGGSICKRRAKNFGKEAPCVFATAKRRARRNICRRLQLFANLSRPLLACYLGYHLDHRFVGKI
jgi:hypothetical protein